MWWYLDQSLGVERWSIQISQIRVRTLLCCKTTPNELWCWRRLLRVPWTSRRSSQSILKEINPEYSLEGLMLKLQYFSHLMQRAGSLKKTLILEKIEGKSKRGQQRMRWLDRSLAQWTWVWANSGRWWRTGKPGVLQSMGSQRVRHDLATFTNNFKPFTLHIPEYSLEGLMLKLQYFGYLMCRADSLVKTLMLGKTEGRRRRGWQRMRWLEALRTQWTWVWVGSGSWWWTGKPGVLRFMGSQRVGHDWVTNLIWSDLKLSL